MESIKETQQTNRKNKINNTLIKICSININRLNNK